MAVTSEKNEEIVRRFSPARVVEHWVHLVLFFMLVATGLSQRYYSFDLSQWFILYLGGIDNIRFFHRLTGVLFSLAVVAHVVAGIVGIVARKWQPSMVITKKDFTDVVHNIRYYLGLENLPAIGHRYTYKQKFEYWGILTSAFVMVFTGAILWFPVQITHVLPGEVIPAAKVMHANQALLVFLIIAIWHIYSAIFSPEVFPLDTSIITGYLSRERMLLEHPLELAERESTGVEEQSPCASGDPENEQ